MEFTTIQIQDGNGNWSHLPLRSEDSPFNESGNHPRQQYIAEPMTYTEQKILDDLNCDRQGNEIPTEAYHHEMEDYTTGEF